MEPGCDNRLAAGSYRELISAIGVKNRVVGVVRRGKGKLGRASEKEKERKKVEAKLATMLWESVSHAAWGEEGLACNKEAISLID